MCIRDRQDHAYALAPDGIDSQRLSGGAVTRVTSAQAPMSIAVDESSIYFADASEDGRVAKVRKTGGAVAVRANRLARVTSLAVDESNAYWVNVNVAILRVSK